MPLETRVPFSQTGTYIDTRDTQPYRNRLALSAPGEIENPRFRQRECSEAYTFSLVVDLARNPGVMASVAGETDGVRTCSGIDHRPLSGFGHRSFVDR
jgi:hypothetical protein